MVMKKIIMCSGILILSTLTVRPQSTKKNSLRQNGTAKISHDKTVSENTLVNSSKTVSLTSTDSYSAKSNTASGPLTLTISDPILRSLNARANGSGVKINKSGIVGMPKSAYGFANGHE